MKKVIVADIRAVTDPNPDLSGVSVKTLIDRDTVGAQRGMLSIAEFAPGGSHKLHRHHASAQISCLLSGQGEHLTANGPVAIKAGDATFVSKNEWHGFRNTGRQAAVLLSIYSPAAYLAEAGYETYLSEINRSTPAAVVKASLFAIQGGTMVEKPGGAVGRGDRWRATGETVGNNDFLLGARAFDPVDPPTRSQENHHRPPHETEFLYILDGGGEYLRPAGAVSLSAGEIAYLSAGDDYGFKNKAGVVTHLLFGYFR